jgi:hypothetical protein
MMVGDAVMGFGRTSCILDVMSVQPTVAYSLRRLSAAYTGKAINVRRSSDNTAMDIGFINNRLDVATLLAFVGTGSGYVATWYNQGTLGSSANLIQTVAANQPQIVSSGALVVFEGQPAVSFSGSPVDLYSSGTPQAVNTNGVWSVNAVANSTSSAETPIICADPSSALGSRVFSLRSNATTGTGSLAGGGIYALAWNPSNTTYTVSTTLSSPQNLITVVQNNSTLALFSNGRTDATTSTGPMAGYAVTLRIGYDGAAGNYFTGTISETMVFASALSTQDRTALETNQANFYLSKPLDALSAGLPTIAYGLRQLTKTYNGACINVRRSSDNTAMDVGFASGQLDTATLLNFVGSGNGFVTKIYNQGTLGSAGNALQSTAAAQPQIVASGVLQTFNSRPALLFSGAQSLQTAGSVQAVGGSALYSVNAVANATSIATQHAMVTQDDANRVFSLRYTNGTQLNAYLFSYNTSGTGEGNNSSETVPPNENVLTATVSSTQILLYSNGRSAATTTISGTLGSGTAPVLLGADIVHGPIYLNGQLSEAMVFPVTLSTADRQTLEHNQEYYFSVTGL